MKSLILAALLVLISACDSTSGPDGSWLVGDEHSGVYVFIQDNDDSEDRTYKGTIYSVNDESIVFQGEFDYSRHVSFDYSNPEIYTNWDGERLYLIDNSFLKAMR